MLKVTVITVTYNAELTIERTLKSILEQSYPSVEIVVIDGASTDRTLMLVQGFGTKIHACYSELDRGIYDAMNKGICKATGEYLIFMNSGDIFSDNFALAKIMEHADVNEECVIFGGWLINRHAGVMRSRVPDLVRGDFNHQATLYSRSIHAWHGGYACIRGLTAADYLFFRTLQATRRTSFRVCSQTVAVTDPFGVSSGLQTYLQRVLIDMLCGYEGRYIGIMKIAIHPIYNKLKKLLVSR